MSFDTRRAWANSGATSMSRELLVMCTMGRPVATSAAHVAAYAAVQLAAWWQSSFFTRSTPHAA